MIALTRQVSHSITRCALTYLDRVPIDYALAVRQHADYCACLEEFGVNVITLPAGEEHPDGCFVEDTAVVVDEAAVICSMGAESRRGETVAVAAELAKYRPVFPIETPALIDGGDVVTMGRRLFVGSSRRTNQAGAAALKKILEPFGYEVQTVELDGCLHLKSACTAITSDTLLVNPACVNSGLFHPLKTVAIPAGEEAAADVLTVGDVVILPQGFPRTRAMLEAMKIEVRCVNVSEFQKAEAGVTCLSIVFASGATDLD